MASEPRLDEAFGAYRDVERPTQAALDDTWAALEARIAAGDTGPRLREDDDATRGDTRERVRALATVAAVAAALGVLWLASPSATRLVADDDELRGVESEHQAVGDEHLRGVVPGQIEPPSHRRSPEHRHRDDELVAPEPEPEPEPAPESESESEPEPEPEPRRQGPAKAKRVVETPPQEQPTLAEPSLADQARALQRIRAVLADDPKAALRHLEAHREQAPASPFAREREALMLLAECRLGRADRVRDRVARVVRAQPDSPLAKRISEACGDDD